MRCRPAVVLLLLILLILPAVLPAQARFIAAGLAGAGFSLDDLGPGTGGGFAYQGAVGVAMRSITIGGEVGEHSRGSDRRTSIFGGFVRFSAFGYGPVQPYFTLGVGGYRYSSGSGSSTTSLGGSVGPGALFRVGIPRVSLALEARIHTDFEGMTQISAQEFATALAGLQIGF